MGIYRNRSIDIFFHKKSRDFNFFSRDFQEEDPTPCSEKFDRYMLLKQKTKTRYNVPFASPLLSILSSKLQYHLSYL